MGHHGDIVPKLPMRSMLVGPSGSGKTVLLTSMILDIYKGCFSRIYVWSPSIEVDKTHGSQLRIISETISNQIIEKSVISIHMTQQS